jgi:hypothetical protein
LLNETRSWSSEMEPLEPLDAGIPPENGVDEGVPWDEEEDELVMFMAQELDDRIFDEESVRPHGGLPRSKRADIPRKVDESLKRIV